LTSTPTPEFPVWLKEVIDRTWGISNRCTAIEDPNTGVKIWETGAIILYLIQKYDLNNQLHYDSMDKEILCKQWLIFQVSGQGPYFGQCNW
jgi:glutathione S-transferase